MVFPSHIEKVFHVKFFVPFCLCNLLVVELFIIAPHRFLKVGEINYLLHITLYKLLLQLEYLHILFS